MLFVRVEFIGIHVECLLLRGLYEGLIKVLVMYFRLIDLLLRLGNVLCDFNEEAERAFSLM